MTLSSPNEPTGGEGGLDVFDREGRFVGRTTTEIEVPSEDLARVAIRVSPEIRERFELKGEFIDVEATLLARAGDEPRLTLLKPIDEALRDEGFVV